MSRPKWMDDGFDWLTYVTPEPTKSREFSDSTGEGVEIYDNHRSIRIWYAEALAALPGARFGDFRQFVWKRWTAPCRPHAFSAVDL